MYYFIEGIATGALFTIGGAITLGFALGHYFKRHPEKLYQTFISPRKNRKNAAD